MNPDIWRKRRVIPEELKTMLDEIYAIDLVLARGFSQEYIWDEETKLYWNSNSQYSVANFYNGISHSDFPKYAVEKVDKVSSYCDSLILETDDEKLKKDVEVCNNMCGMMLMTIVRCWMHYYPINAFGNKENKSYLVISSWNSYDWSKCPAFVFAEWINRRQDTGLSDGLRCKGLFMEAVDNGIQSFFPELYPENKIRTFFAYSAVPGETCYGLEYIGYKDLLSVMTVRPGKESYVNKRLKYIDNPVVEQPRAYNQHKDGYTPVLSSESLCKLIQSGYIR